MYVCSVIIPRYLICCLLYFLSFFFILYLCAYN